MNIYVDAYTYKISTTLKKRPLILKSAMKGYMEGFGGQKGKGE